MVERSFREMSITPTSVRFPSELYSHLKKLVDEGKYSSISFAVIALVEEALASKTEEPLSLDLILQAVLGDELYQRHIDFLKKEKQEGENLDNVFRRFIKSAGVQITKEEWLERVKEGEKVDHFKVLDPSPCHYRAITETGEWYCDTKKIPPAVCIKRQERFEYMKKRCTPITGRKTLATQKPASNRRFCKRDQHWFNIGEKNCLECKWLPKECPVKKEALRDRSQ